MRELTVVPQVADRGAPAPAMAPEALLAELPQLAADAPTLAGALRDRPDLHDAILGWAAGALGNGTVNGALAMLTLAAPQGAAGGGAAQAAAGSAAQVAGGAAQATAVSEAVDDVDGRDEESVRPHHGGLAALEPLALGPEGAASGPARARADDAAAGPVEARTERAHDHAGSAAIDVSYLGPAGVVAPRPPARADQAPAGQSSVESSSNGEALQSLRSLGDAASSLHAERLAHELAASSVPDAQIADVLRALAGVGAGVGAATAAATLAFSLSAAVTFGASLAMIPVVTTLAGLIGADLARLAGPGIGVIGVDQQVRQAAAGLATARDREWNDSTATDLVAAAVALTAPTSAAISEQRSRLAHDLSRQDLIEADALAAKESAVDARHAAATLRCSPALSVLESFAALLPPGVHIDLHARQLVNQHATAQEQAADTIIAVADRSIGHARAMKQVVAAALEALAALRPDPDASTLDLLSKTSRAYSELHNAIGGGPW